MVVRYAANGIGAPSPTSASGISGVAEWARWSDRYAVPGSPSRSLRHRNFLAQVPFALLKRDGISLPLAALEIGYAPLHVGSLVCIIEKLLGLLLTLSPLLLVLSTLPMFLSTFAMFLFSCGTPPMFLFCRQFAVRSQRPRWPLNRAPVSCGASCIASNCRMARHAPPVAGGEDVPTGEPGQASSMQPGCAELRRCSRRAAVCDRDHIQVVGLYRILLPSVASCANGGRAPAVLGLPLR
jgi:hypothetical protein